MRSKRDFLRARSEKKRGVGRLIPAGDLATAAERKRSAQASANRSDVAECQRARPHWASLNSGGSRAIVPTGPSCPVFGARLTVKLHYFVPQKKIGGRVLYRISFNRKTDGELLVTTSSPSWCVSRGCRSGKRRRAAIPGLLQRHGVCTSRLPARQTA